MVSDGLFDFCHPPGEAFGDDFCDLLRLNYSDGSGRVLIGCLVPTFSISSKPIENHTKNLTEMHGFLTSTSPADVGGTHKDECIQDSLLLKNHTEMHGFSTSTGPADVGGTHKGTCTQDSRM